MNESNNEQNVGRTNEEIDLIELCSMAWEGVKNFFISIKDIFIAFIIFAIRKSLWIGSFALIGLILGLMYSNSIKKTYYSSMLEGFSGGVDNAVVINHINQLERIITKPEILANHLNISVEQAKKVHSVKAFYGIDVNFDEKWDYIDENDSSIPRSLKDTVLIRVPSVFFIKVQLYDEDVLPVVRNRLFQYINDNPYIRSLYEIDRRQKEDMIAGYEKEINRIDRLDSLQHLLRHSRDNGVEMAEKIYLFGNNESELKMFYRNIIELHTDKQELEREIEIANQPVIIVQDFVAAQWEEKTTSYYASSLCMIMGCMGLFCALLWQHRKRLWKIIMEDN